MSDYKTANLKPETMERLREYAVGDESVDSAVQRLLDSSGSNGGEDIVPVVEETVHNATCDLATVESIQDLTNAVKEATQAAQSAERSVEQLQ